MVHINKVKLFNGELRYAVVEPFTSTVVVLKESKDKESKPVKEVVTVTEELPVEYRSGDSILPAVFPLTAEGLEQAKEIQKLFNKSKK